MFIILLQIYYDIKYDQILEKNVLKEIDDSINNIIYKYLGHFNFILSIIYTVWWFRWVCKQNVKYQILETEDIDGEFGALHTDKCIDDDDDYDYDIKYNRNATIIIIIMLNLRS